MVNGRRSISQSKFILSRRKVNEGGVVFTHTPTYIPISEEVVIFPRKMRESAYIWISAGGEKVEKIPLEVLFFAT